MSKRQRSPLHVCVGSLLALLLGARGPSLAAQATTPEDSVRAVETARGEALLQADTVALGRMVADEFIEISRLGTRRTRADNIRDIGRWQAVAMQQTSMP